MLDMTQRSGQKTERAPWILHSPRVVDPVDRGTNVSDVAGTKGLTFEELLSHSMKEVNRLQLEADEKMHKLAIGEAEDISEVVLASSRAEIAMKLMVEIRNKFVDAYQALSRISG